MTDPDQELFPISEDIRNIHFRLEMIVTLVTVHEQWLTSTLNKSFDNIVQLVQTVPPIGLVPRTHGELTNALVSRFLKYINHKMELIQLSDAQTQALYDPNKPILFSEEAPSAQNPLTHGPCVIFEDPTILRLSWQTIVNKFTAVKIDFLPIAFYGNQRFSKLYGNDIKIGSFDQNLFAIMESFHFLSQYPEFIESSVLRKTQLTGEFFNQYFPDRNEVSGPEALNRIFELLAGR